MFYMYIFNEGISEPIGYYQVNKVSSVNSQLTNTEQVISGNSNSNSLPAGTVAIIPSPAEGRFLWNKWRCSIRFYSE